jgi:SAM-dependent methyltransferase
MHNFDNWLRALEERHFADLTFPEVARALRALSSAYVERRGRLKAGAALSGAGKRAAFALFYGPLHYLLVREIAAATGLRPPRLATIIDLGCGTGAAGAAWAQTCPKPPAIVGLDVSSWALSEASRTYRAFDLSARTRLGDIATAAWPPPPGALLAAFTLNELGDAARETVLRRLVERGERGDAVLVVEPVAGFVAPWWNRWRAAFEGAGGRAADWRFRVELPAIVTKLDRAAGLDHRALTGRSLWFG